MIETFRPVVWRERMPANKPASRTKSMSVKILLSCVSDEFRAYRDQLRRDLTRHNVSAAQLTRVWFQGPRQRREDSRRQNARSRERLRKNLTERKIRSTTN
jgi:hypothetical protein